MNLIVGAILNHAEEYMAFWMTCMIFESLEMRDIFLPGELVDRSVLNGLYTDRLTRNSEACVAFRLFDVEAYSLSPLNICQKNLKEKLFIIYL